MEISEHVYDFDSRALEAPGIAPGTVPSESTVCRVLSALDADDLDSRSDGGAGPPKNPGDRGTVQTDSVGRPGNAGMLRFQHCMRQQAHRKHRRIEQMTNLDIYCKVSACSPMIC